MKQRNMNLHKKYLNEVRLQPVVILDSLWDTHCFTTNRDGGMSHIRELRRRVISPDYHLVHILR